MVGRDHRVLRELERQLRRDDPIWVQTFAMPWWRRREVWLDSASGTALVLAAVAVLLGVPEAVVLLGTVAVVLAIVRYSPVY